MMKTWGNFFHLARSLYSTDKKKNLSKFYFLPYTQVNLTKKKISISNCNKWDICMSCLIPERRSRVWLLLECKLLQVACLVTALMLLTLFLVKIGDTSMLVELPILRLEIEVTQVISKIKKIFVVQPDFLRTTLLIVKIFIYFSRAS